MLEKDRWTKEKHEKNVLFIYILMNLSRGKMSGYDIIKTISKRTGGRWTPSKGALYPLLENMGRNGVIKAVEKGSRGKKIYGLTEKGRQIMKEIKKRKLNFRERMKRFMPLILDMLPKRKRAVMEQAFQILETSLEKLRGNENAINTILDECLNKLRLV